MKRSVISIGSTSSLGDDKMSAPTSQSSQDEDGGAASESQVVDAVKSSSQVGTEITEVKMEEVSFEFMRLQHNIQYLFSVNLSS